MTGMPRPTVLLVDDEPDILTALEDLLEDEYRLLSANSPEQGLALLAADPDVSVIVSDQRMPGMTGDVFLARARALGVASSRAEAVLLTGYADLSAVVAALNDGRISGYAHKPWEPLALRAMIRQAADRAGLAQALRLEQTLLRGLLDGIPDGLAFKDGDGRFIRLNRIAAARLGADVAACIGRTEPEIAGPALVGLAEQDQAVLAAGVPDTMLHARQIDGRTVWLERMRGPLRDADATTGLLAVVERDVTDARAMEDRLRQADRMQALGTMAGGVAHDFNNLLTAVLGSLELAQAAVMPAAMSAASDGNEAKLRRLIGTAIAGAERGAALTQRLLSFSRRQELSSRPLDLNRLIEAMDDLLTRSIDRDAIVIERTLEPGLPAALADAAELELALLNLCVNARDAMDDAGTITLRTRVLAAGSRDDHRLLAGRMPEGGAVAVAVEDTGIGMDEAVASRIFEPFFTTKPIGRGTGLGLSMVYGFIQQVGGAVRVRTAPGCGTSFELCLPLAP